MLITLEVDVEVDGDSEQDIARRFGDGIGDLAASMGAAHVPKERAGHIVMRGGIHLTSECGTADTISDATGFSN
jgi:hypothetical protein